MLNINIESNPHDLMRYDTLGDWQFEGDTINIQVSTDAGSDDHQFLIALHELVEIWLCKKRGISTETVDKFDFAFTGDGEPGDEVDCPYRKEHRFAMLIEHLMAHELQLTGYGTIT